MAAPSSRMDVPYRLQLEGHMTLEHRRELESCIIDAMQRHQSLEVDLSAVREIDLYGVHLLGLLQSVAAVVAISPCVEEAARRLLKSYLGNSLVRVAGHGDAHDY
jgi:ABC-type transporter Mla MlaB component